MKVGQTVWVRGGFPPRDIEADVISKIGNKYFYLVGQGDRKFDLKSLRSVTDSNYPYQVHLSLDEYRETIEMTELGGKLRKAFSGWAQLPYTLDQLRRINAILEEVQ